MSLPGNQKFLKRTLSGTEAWKTQALKPTERRLLGLLKEPISVSELDNLGIPDVDLLVASMSRRGWVATSTSPVGKTEEDDEIQTTSKKILDMIESQSPSIIDIEDSHHIEAKPSEQSPVAVRPPLAPHQEHHKHPHAETPPQPHQQPVVYQQPVYAPMFSEEELKRSALKLISDIVDSKNKK